MFSIAAAFLLSKDRGTFKSSGLLKRALKIICASSFVNFPGVIIQLANLKHGRVRKN